MFLFIMFCKKNLSEFYVEMVLCHLAPTRVIKQLTKPETKTSTKKYIFFTWNKVNINSFFFQLVDKAAFLISVWFNLMQ